MSDTGRPGADAPRVAVVGAGRAGGSFAAALSAVGWAVVGPLGRGEWAPSVGRDVDVVLLCVGDAAVASVAAGLDVDDRPGAAVIVHVAGSLGLDVLAPHRRVASVHPLAALPDPAIGGRRLRSGITYAVAGDPVAARMVGDLGGRALVVDDDHRAAYHAAAVIASNHLVGLLGQVERVAATAGLPLDAYLGLVRDTVDNVAELGPAAALTGPAARGDDATVARHLAAIAAEERPAYAAASELCRRLAGRGAS